MDALPLDFLTIDHIRSAQVRISGAIQRTPVLTSRTLDQLSGARLYFKCENFQTLGAFKVRGATNAVLLLSDGEACNGVATHSSGNHAAALARAARRRGIAAHIVMPRTTSKSKVSSVERQGARILFCEPTQAARQAAAAAVVADTGAVMIHPFDHPPVMAGQGTVALELLEDVPDLDMVVCPVGGGGLLSGTATAIKALRPGTKVVGAEPAGADDAARSFGARRLLSNTDPCSIADGLLASLSKRTFAVIRTKVEAIVTVPDESILRAMRLHWEIMKMIVEPSGAVGLAALLEGGLDVKGQRIGVIVTGGNLDLERLPWQVPGS